MMTARWTAQIVDKTVNENINKNINVELDELTDAAVCMVYERERE